MKPTNQPPMQASTKESIKSRMLKNSAYFWGFTDADIDSFDPIVKLLIEACASEIFKISNEVSSSQSRGLSRLAKLLTPDSYTGPKPAHAVLYAKPNDKQLDLKQRHQLFFQKRVPSKVNGIEDSNIDIYFSPVRNTKLFNAHVKYIGTGQNLFSISDMNSKEFFLKAKYGSAFSPQTVWLGLEVDNELKDLSELCFFLDWKNKTDKNDLYHEIQYTKWYIQNELIAVENSLPVSDPLNYGILEEFETMNLLEQEILELYNQRFMHFKSNPEIWKRLLESKSRFPDEFRSVLVEDELYQLSEPLLWIKVMFPPVCDEETLEDIFFSTNCFPVVNRHLNEIRYQLQNFLNIVPLLTKEHYLGIHLVNGTDGVKYTNLIFDQAESEKDEQMVGTYSVREGGVERFDERGASEYLEYLIELLRDESTAFAALGQDFNTSMIKDLNQRISLIENKTKLGYEGLNNLPAYMIVRPRNPGETIFIEFWSCNGAFANNLRIGGRLNQYEGADLNNHSITFMTNSIGGRDRLTGNEVLQTYKSALMTRGKIVTIQDIINTCTAELGERIRKVEVAKGVAVGEKENEGLMRTLDVYITPTSMEMYSPEDWEVIKQDLKVKLTSRSVVFNNYRVIIKN